MRAKEVFAGDHKVRLDEIISRTLKTWFAEPPEAEELPELEIINADKLAG